MKIQGDPSYDYQEEFAKERYYENKPQMIDEFEQSEDELGIAIKLFTWILGIALGLLIGHILYKL